LFRRERLASCRAVSEGTAKHRSRVADRSEHSAIRERLTDELRRALARTPHKLHVILERDVGLFSLIQQVVANVPWALSEGRVPIADLRERTCYWVPGGWHGAQSVWEYYFEALVDGFPAAAVPAHVRATINQRFPEQDELGFAIGEVCFVTNHFGDHPNLRGVAPLIPYTTGNPDAEVRQQAAAVMGAFVRARQRVARKAQVFFDEHLRGDDVIGVHVRGTDAVSERETREYRQGSLDLSRYVETLERLLTERPYARLLIATDAQASLNALTEAFGERVVAYDAVRHQDGEAAGSGPTGCIMPAYIADDPRRAAQNGEDAVVEYLLLRRCAHFVHNGASLAVTVLLAEPALPHTNTHRPA
jgi:hypothetical protein